VDECYVFHNNNKIFLQKFEWVDNTFYNLV